MRKIARFVVSKRIPILVIGLVLTVACAVMAFFVNINYDLTAYLPKDFHTSKAIAIMNDEFGDVEESGILITIDDIFEEKRNRHISTYSENDTK